MMHGLRRIIAKGYGHAVAIATGPRILAYLPAMVLLGFWMGGELLLIGTALGVPLLMTAAGVLGIARMIGLSARFAALRCAT